MVLGVKQRTYSAQAAGSKMDRPVPGFDILFSKNHSGWDGLQHALRHAAGLGHEGPVPGFQAPGAGGVAPDVAAGEDIEHGAAGDGVWVVEHHAVDGAPAAVVAGGHEAVVAEGAHDFDLVLSHDAEAVGWRRWRRARGRSCRRSREGRWRRRGSARRGGWRSCASRRGFAGCRAAAARAGRCRRGGRGCARRWCR